MAKLENSYSFMIKYSKITVWDALPQWEKKNANVCFEWPLQLDDKDFPRLLACITIVRDTSK